MHILLSLLRLKYLLHYWLTHAYLEEIDVDRVMSKLITIYPKVVLADVALFDSCVLHLV